MRKNTARHWLHAVLDLLPVLLIPVFMIYSHRHTIDSGSIDVPVNKVVDFNQLVNYDNVFSSINQNDITITKLNNGYFRANGTANADTTIFLSSDGTNNDNFIQYETNHKYLMRFIDGGSYQTYYASWTLSGSLLNQGSIIATSDNNYPRGYVYFFVRNGATLNNLDFYINVFDLTQMFGVGNEPTIEQFSQWYSNDSYQYTLSHKELLKGVSTQTYNDTDIMSQFTYQLYNSVDKYFNMGNVFGMSNVYDWFVLNIFGGNASISIYIVWNIVLYEFVMDLLFLLYALFMWFIDVTKRLIEKPLDSIK